MQIFVLTLIRNCSEAPFLANIRATSLELPQHLLLLYVHSLPRKVIYVHGCEGFFYTYLIKQCDPLLFMNLFCWDGTNPPFAGRETVEMKRKPNQDFECSLSASDLYTPRIFIDYLVGWREFLEKRERKLKFELSPFHMSKCANYTLKIYSTNYYFLWIKLILAFSGNKTYQMLSFLFQIDKKSVRKSCLDIKASYFTSW